jgi:hypothetical protein
MSERVAHDHAAYVPGCFRCDLSRAEVRVDRDALIAAAKEAAQARGWITEWTTVAAMVDAVVARVAGAIEAEAATLRSRILDAAADLGPLARTMHAEVDGRLLAARLVRSFGGGQ